MANYKRKKPRTQVKCVLCTDNRNGNSKSQLKIRDKKNNAKADQELKE